MQVEAIEALRFCGFIIWGQAMIGAGIELNKRSCPVLLSCFHRWYSALSSTRLSQVVCLHSPSVSSSFLCIRDISNDRGVRGRTMPYPPKSTPIRTSSDSLTIYSVRNFISRKIDSSLSLAGSSQRVRCEDLASVTIHHLFKAEQHFHVVS